MHGLLRPEARCPPSAEPEGAGRSIARELKLGGAGRRLGWMRVAGAGGPGRARLAEGAGGGRRRGRGPAGGAGSRGVASGGPRNRTWRCGFGDRRVSDTPVPRGRPF
jgi:hypothetical protein